MRWKKRCVQPLTVTLCAESVFRTRKSQLLATSRTCPAWEKSQPFVHNVREICIRCARYAARGIRRSNSYCATAATTATTLSVSRRRSRRFRRTTGQSTARHHVMIMYGFHYSSSCDKSQREFHMYTCTHVHALYRLRLPRTRHHCAARGLHREPSCAGRFCVACEKLARARRLGHNRPQPRASTSRLRQRCAPHPTTQRQGCACPQIVVDL